MELTENALAVAKSRYLGENESWDDCLHRVARCVAQHEDKNWENNFYELMNEMKFLPAGRILRNAGKSKGSLFNCFVLSPGDSIEEIGEFYKQCMLIWSNGGGVGANFSSLRPVHTTIQGKGGKSSGLVSFMQGADAISKTIESGGGRRAASLACVKIEHPEVLNFIKAKREKEELTYFNISVGITNEFLDAVELNRDWTFRFNHQDYGTSPAKEIWKIILEGMVKNGEPGLLNFSNLLKNNSYYFDPPDCTNPCGEATLSVGEACCLGSLVLPNINKSELQKTVETAIRFLDNVIDVNYYILPLNDIKTHNSRRIGLGIMGLADLLFENKLKYNSLEGIDFAKNLIKEIRNYAYEASMKLAKEKGAFPKFEPIAFCNSSFVKTFPFSFRRMIKKEGIRNVSLMMLAPTGTISLLANCSSGIEPIFATAMKRSDRVGERYYIHPLYKKYIKEKKPIPDWFVDAFDVSPEWHLSMQAELASQIDGSISKTINLPRTIDVDSSIESLSGLLLESMRNLKGVTVYPDGGREGQILTRLTEEEVREIKEIRQEISPCSAGECDI